MEINQFGRIGVLMGGPSSERDISLKSGKAVYEALSQSGIDAVAIDIKTDCIDENISLIKSHKINCAFLALHGRFGEDGQIQQILETIKTPYTGSGVLASRLGMDKAASRWIFEAANLRVPKYKVLDKISYNKGLRARNTLDNLGLPLVIKPARHGSSVGLSIIDKEEGLAVAIDLAFTFDEKIMIEEYIEGREVTVGILDNFSLPPIEIIPKRRFFDYEAKYKAGMTDYVVPAKLEKRIDKKIRKTAYLAHRLLGCSGCSRVDTILDKQDEPVVLEINTIPGLTETSLLPKAAKVFGIEFSELCLKLIKLAYGPRTF
jgi:D-alanine-D-alanine ligase